MRQGTLLELVEHALLGVGPQPQLVWCASNCGHKPPRLHLLAAKQWEIEADHVDAGKPLVDVL
ncbi:hypothetical protein WJ06_28415 [Burkholderia cepacia]|nr:hypothetical protein WJ06_28415 [Burkholderia cepacia]